MDYPDSSTPKGLGTNLRPTNGCGPDDNIPTSKEVEGFLYELEKILIDHLDEMKKRDTRKVNGITSKINHIFAKLKQRSDIVVARTDKTNSIRVMKTNSYIESVERHLKKDAVETTYGHLQEVHKKALELLTTIDDLVSENEFRYIKSTITKRAIPTVQLLIKDHKKIDESTGEYPSRLVVPAKNFTAAYPHIGQRGIFEILKRNKVNYTDRNIEQTGFHPRRTTYILSSFACVTPPDKTYVRTKKLEIIGGEKQNFVPSVDPQELLYPLKLRHVPLPHA